jgi:hypothetical protein
MANSRTHCHCRAALLASCLLSLGGCSGGGGGGSPVAAAPPPAPVTPAPQTSGIAVNLQAAKTTVAYQAAAATVLGASKGMGNIIFSAAGQGATLTLSTDASGNLSGVIIPAGGITDTVSGAGGTGASLTSPLTLDFTFQLNDTLAFTNEHSYTLSQVAAGQGLTSSAYGLWASTGGRLPGDAGAFAFGNLTPAASAPTTGSATFNGFSIGMGGAIDSGATHFLKGNAQIVVNFATQNVTTNLTNFVTGSYTSSAKPSVPDLTGTSTIAGNAYAGAISGGGLAGTINGNFYGTAAQETAGVWQAAGGGNAWIGSFGAK